MPKTNVQYWRRKIQRNRGRDLLNVDELRRLGWAAGVVWECELNDECAVLERLMRFLGPRRVT